MEFSVWHLAIIAIVVLVFFGGRKIPEMMHGLGQGIREFKEGMREPPPTNPPASTTTANPPAPAPTEEKK
jgi:sec-independent protein translocase protein TatA